MTRTNFLITLFVLAGFGSGCRDARPVEDHGTSTVVAIQGPVFLKRADWVNYAPVLFGTVLRMDDLLKVGNIASGKVICGDLTIVPLVPGNVGPVSCPHVEPLMKHAGTEILPTRDAGSSGPVLVYPAANQLADVRTGMSWILVPQARRYEITVDGADGPQIHWTRTVAAQGLETRMCSFSERCALFPYPADGPSLVEGKTYTITIKAQGDTVSPDEAQERSTFRVLSAKQREELNANLERIRNSGLNRQAIEYLMANFYLDLQLTGDATNRLQILATDNQEPAVERLLGQAYLAAGLSRLAAFAYSQSSKEATDKGDIEGQAIAEDALATIYARDIFNPAEAKLHLSAAMGLYTKLGDDRALRRLSDNLQKLPAVGNK